MGQSFHIAGCECIPGLSSSGLLDSILPGTSHVVDRCPYTKHVIYGSDDVHVAAKSTRELDVRAAGQNPAATPMCPLRAPFRAFEIPPHPVPPMHKSLPSLISQDLNLFSKLEIPAPVCCLRSEVYSSDLPVCPLR